MNKTPATLAPGASEIVRAMTSSGSSDPFAGQSLGRVFRASWKPNPEYVTASYACTGLDRAAGLLTSSRRNPVKFDELQAHFNETESLVESRKQLQADRWTAAWYVPQSPTPQVAPKEKLLPFTFGFELTAIVRGYREEPDEICGGTDPVEEVADRTLARARELVEYLHKHGYPNFYPDSYVDGHCIEIPSPVFTTFASALKFYRTCWKFLKRYATPHNRLTVCGGNHFHFGVDTPLRKQNLVRHFVNHPFIAWVFTAPDDTDSCNNPCTDEDFTKFRRGEIVNFGPHKQALKVLTGEGVAHFNKADGFSGCKEWGCVINQVYETVEFRAVEAPLNESEFVDQAEFYCAYVKHFCDMLAAPVKFMSVRALRRITAKQAIADFNELCLTIGVNPKRYRKYINRNLKPRWKLGRTRY